MSRERTGQGFTTLSPAGIAGLLVGFSSTVRKSPQGSAKVERSKITYPKRHMFTLEEIMSHAEASIYVM